MTCQTTRTCQNCQKIKELIDQNIALRKELDDFKRKLIHYENPHTPPSRRLYAAKNGDHTKNTKNTKRYPGRPKGHVGTTRSKPKIPDTVIAPPKKTVCSHCGASLKETHVNHRVIEEISSRQSRQVIDFLQFEYQCTKCSSPDVSSHPDCPPEGVFGVNALSQTTLLKFNLRLPYDKVAEQMKAEHNLPMTAATAFEITDRVSSYLQPHCEAVAAQVKASPIVNVDETSVKVDGKNYWLWVFVAATCTFFVVRKSRSKKVLEEVLGKDFTGFIGCDGWKSYVNFTGRLQRCWAHLLREAEAVAKDCEEAQPLYLGLKRLYWDAQYVLGVAPFWMCPGIKEEAEKRLDALLAGCVDLKSREAKRLAQKVRNGFDHWFTFMVVPGLEATNNRAENALREAVVQRKIFGTLRNEKGTRIYGTMMTVITTWKQQKLNLNETLPQKLTEVWAMKQS
jgi:transposase